MVLPCTEGDYDTNLQKYFFHLLLWEVSTGIMSPWSTGVDRPEDLMCSALQVLVEGHL